MKTKRPSRASRVFIVTTLLGSMSICGYLSYFYSDTPQASAQVVATETPHSFQLLEPSVASSSAEQVATESDHTGLDRRSVASYSAKDQSVFIDEAVQEFLPTHYSEGLMIMHCLAHRENGHGGNPNAHGDNGLAGGPFQFHQATWNRMRKQMDESEGSRYDFKEAARTTAWALANGRAKEWGPVKRYFEGSDFATCPYPSWYSERPQ